MAFIDNFKKLVSRYGEELIIKDKDKAIIDLANEIANGGGGGETKRIVSCWKEISENEFEEIEKEVGQEKYLIESNSEGTYLFTTDENKPKDNDENVALYIIIHSGNSGIDVGTSNIITDMAFISTKDESNNLVAPNTIIRIGQDPYLIIDIRYNE